LPHIGPLGTTDRFVHMREDPELLRMLYDINPTLVFVKDRQGHFVFPMGEGVGGFAIYRMLQKQYLKHSYLLSGRFSRPKG
jgi:hypothetical protein